MVSCCYRGTDGSMWNCTAASPDFLWSVSSPAVFRSLWTTFRWRLTMVSILSCSSADMFLCGSLEVFTMIPDARRFAVMPATVVSSVWLGVKVWGVGMFPLGSMDSMPRAVASSSPRSGSARCPSTTNIVDVCEAPLADVRVAVISPLTVRYWFVPYGLSHMLDSCSSPTLVW